MFLYVELIVRNSLIYLLKRREQGLEPKHVELEIWNLLIKRKTVYNWSGEKLTSTMVFWCGPAWSLGDAASGVVSGPYQQKNIFYEQEIIGLFWQYRYHAVSDIWDRTVFMRYLCLVGTVLVRWLSIDRRDCSFLKSFSLFRTERDTT